MTRLALVSDIHGNGVAFEAVVADVTHVGVDEMICLGDIAAGGPQPCAVIARLRELGCRCIRGNADGWLLDGLPPGRSEETRRLGDVVAWTRAGLSAADSEYLVGLPATLSVMVEDVGVLCFHGSPRSDVQRLIATTSDDELEDAFGAAPESLFVGGHTHLQLLRRHRDRLLINPGSVGLPLGALAGTESPLPTWAEYALLEVKAGAIEIAFRRLAVDVEALATATAAMPHASWAADLERRIRRWNARPQ
jgi:putative phosphoesterase